MTKQPEVGVAMRRAFTPEIRSVDEAKRRITFVASDPTVDRYGDRILTSGWQLESYRKNPIVLWAHKSGEPPIGKCVDVRIEDAPPALVQTVEFADKSTYEFADTIFSLYKGKFLNAVSVGFMPTKEPTRIMDEKGNWTGGFEFDGQELLELSCVPVPANPSALARCVQKGFSEADLQRVFTPMTEAEAYKELAEINHQVARVAIALAREALLKADELRALLKAAQLRGVNLTADLTLAELLAAIRGAGPSVPDPTGDSTGDGEITSIEQLSEALLEGDAEFEQALGIGGEGDGLERSPAGSRRWRDPGSRHRFRG